MVHKAVDTINEHGTGGFLLVCEHASNQVPAELDGLGLNDKQIASHIAWDPGALDVAKRLSSALDSPLVSACISRLVYDCNRPPESPDAICSLSERDTIPGNLNLSAKARQSRIDQVYRPFQQAVAKLASATTADNHRPLLVTIHSFVPVYKGVGREVEIGILHDSDTRIADLMLDPEAPHNGLRFRRNEPYGPVDGVTHTLKEHGLANGLANVMIEIRNDLLVDSQGQQQIADILIEQLQRVRQQLHPSSRAPDNTPSTSSPE
ncbi:N-formylglutamate amidohydrolase [Aestuariirhabdus sp. Z084]|uniref:N-formylglutamate amidohydrolase n=1 Tax=Aestuariirhabdus haliotis TaxID=2918751 RepID=UPI00201B367B|nr:N-formylglutamate amidohydrolase [Aestuariirhabdus haliotis]MCL6415452.1 N-formylglutamate amidohydrolase [Aestuariirhabdus haliotis]MCL6419208.1 N-formylglutamate amidohydrolase [Aestuariirhabdus haliotis]